MIITISSKKMIIIRNKYVSVYIYMDNRYVSRTEIQMQGLQQNGTYSKAWILTEIFFGVRGFPLTRKF